jgi:hypothetical protein
MTLAEGQQPTNVGQRVAGCTDPSRVRRGTRRRCTWSAERCFGHIHARGIRTGEASTGRSTTRSLGAIQNA